jgi:hypothetical protein
MTNAAAETVVEAGKEIPDVAPVEDVPQAARPMVRAVPR